MRGAALVLGLALGGPVAVAAEEAPAELRRVAVRADGVLLLDGFPATREELRAAVRAAPDAAWSMRVDPAVAVELHWLVSVATRAGLPRYDVGVEPVPAPLPDGSPRPSAPAAAPPVGDGPVAAAPGAARRARAPTVRPVGELRFGALGLHAGAPGTRPQGGFRVGRAVLGVRGEAAGGDLRLVATLNAVEVAGAPVGELQPFTPAGPPAGAAAVPGFVVRPWDLRVAAALGGAGRVAVEAGWMPSLIGFADLANDPQGGVFVGQPSHWGVGVMGGLLPARDAGVAVRARPGNGAWAGELRAVTGAGGGWVDGAGGQELQARVDYAPAPGATVRASALTGVRDAQSGAVVAGGGLGALLGGEGFRVHAELLSGRATPASGAAGEGFFGGELGLRGQVLRPSGDRPALSAGLRGAWWDPSLATARGEAFFVAGGGLMAAWEGGPLPVAATVGLEAVGPNDARLPVQRRAQAEALVRW